MTSSAQDRPGTRQRAGPRQRPPRRRASCASRARLVEVADAERKRIQRNLHDGAQQRITSVLLTLGRMRALHAEPDALLAFAIDELALRAPMPVEIDAPVGGKLSEQVEAAAYYVVAEALANVNKHAGASRISVRARTDDGLLVITVVDDGVGGAKAEGEGLRGLADRVEALGGRLTLDSPPGGGTRLQAQIPR